MNNWSESLLKENGYRIGNCLIEQDDEIPGQMDIYSFLDKENKDEN